MYTHVNSLCVCVDNITYAGPVTCDRSSVHVPPLLGPGFGLAANEVIVGFPPDPSLFAFDFLATEGFSAFVESASA